jgi:hypothetical protein
MFAPMLVPMSAATAVYFALGLWFKIPSAAQMLRLAQAQILPEKWRK